EPLCVFLYASGRRICLGNPKRRRGGALQNRAEVRATMADAPASWSAADLPHLSPKGIVLDIFAACLHSASGDWGRKDQRTLGGPAGPGTAEPSFTGA